MVFGSNIVRDAVWKNPMESKVVDVAKIEGMEPGDIISSMSDNNQCHKAPNPEYASKVIKPSCWMVVAV